jgi:hypothetical protein
VNSADHDVNLNLEFKDWQAGKHWFINVLLYIKKIFHFEPMFNLPDSEQPSDRSAL